MSYATPGGRRLSPQVRRGHVTGSSVSEGNSVQQPEQITPLRVAHLQILEGDGAEKGEEDHIHQSNNSSIISTPNTPIGIRRERGSGESRLDLGTSYSSIEDFDISYVPAAVQLSVLEEQSLVFDSADLLESPEDAWTSSEAGFDLIDIE